jgi:hypothetical protein
MFPRNIYIFIYFFQDLPPLITHSMVLEDITGKVLSAVDVFTLSMKALVDHLMKMLTKQRTTVRRKLR